MEVRLDYDKLQKDPGKKRSREDSGCDTQDSERQPKRLKLDESFLTAPDNNGFETTPRKSPADSAYDSNYGKSPYFSYPSVGTSSGIDISPQSTPNPKCTGFKLDEYGFRSHADLVNFCRKKYKCLKDELDPKNVLADTLYAQHVLSDKDMEQLLEEPSRMRRADILIKALAHPSKSNIPGIYRIVRDAFKNENLEHLLSFSGTDTEEKHVRVLDMTQLTEEFLMSELQVLAKGLEDNLEPKDIIDDLLVSGLLTFLDHEDIYRTTSRLDRVKSVVDYVKRAGNKKFHLFVDALSVEYPDLIKQQKDKQLHHLLPAKEMTLELRQRTNSNTTPRNTTSPNFLMGVSMMELKIHSNGPESVQDVEMLAVDNNNRTLNLPLEEEAMEIGNASVLHFEFSSVRIKFAALSEEAVSKFKEALDDPARLQRIITHMFTQDQLRTLEARNIQTMTIELIIPVDSFVGRKCTCKLSKKVVVKSFTYLERELPDIMMLINAFVSSPLLDDISKKELNQLKDNEPSSAIQKEQFLRKLLILPEEFICVFEKQLKCMNQQNLIQTLVEKQTSDQEPKSSCNIGPKDIRRNMSFLENEIEPKIFVSVFENTDIKTDDIISSDSRRNRCSIFLKSILKVGQVGIDKFRRELERRGMHFVIDVLCKKEAKNRIISLENIRKNVLRYYATIVQEIEPTRLREKLVLETVFKAKEFDEIHRVSVQRRERVVWLIRKLLQKDISCFAIFVDALKIANCPEIVKLLMDTSDDSLECPFLESKLQEKTTGAKQLARNNLTFTAEFDVNWIKETPTESELQLSLHKEIYKTNEVDKTEYTDSWVTSHLNVSGIEVIATGEYIEEQQKTENSEFGDENSKTNEFEPKAGDVKNTDLRVSFRDALLKPNDTFKCSQTLEYCMLPTDHVGEMTNVSPHVFAPTTVHSEIEKKTKQQVPEFKTGDVNCRDTYSIPSLDSYGAPSPYRNEFEDISPCASPSQHSQSQHVGKVCSTRPKPVYYTNLFPSSPIGSVGTGCISFDSLSPSSSTGFRSRKASLKETDETLNFN